MSNRFRGMVTIKLDKARNLRYGMNAIIECEEELGFKITEISGKNLGIKEIQTLVYHGLKHEDESLTFKGTGDLIDEADSFAYVAEKMSEALSLAFDKKAKPQVNKAGE